MLNNRFVILTGHLNDYPLSDLVGILRHQRKTGRLLIEYAKGPAVFFFYEGNLVDAKLNDLTGLQAVCFALGQPPASFNFNPLIQPSQKTIEDSLQRTVSEMFGCWDESPVEIASEAIDIPLLSDTYSKPVALPLERSPAYGASPLALPPAAIASSRRPASLLLVTAAGLATLGVSTAIALSGSFRTSNTDTHDAMERLTTPAAVTAPLSSGLRTPVAKNLVEGTTRSRQRSTNERSAHSERAAARKDANSSGRDRTPGPAGDTEAKQKSAQSESVTVVMEIENGRVLRASIANPKPGLDSYEALALRIARQRRYSSQQNGRETVKIKVSPSN